MKLGIGDWGLDTLGKKIGDQGLKILCSVKFKKLEQLLLEENAKIGRAHV